MVKLTPVTGANLNLLFEVAPKRPRTIILAPSAKKFTEGIPLVDLLLGTYTQLLLPYGGVALGGTYTVSGTKWYLGIAQDHHVVMSDNPETAKWSSIKLDGHPLHIFINQPGA